MTVDETGPGIHRVIDDVVTVTHPGRCGHVDRYRVGDPPRERHRRCPHDATWLCPGALWLCDDHARGWLARQTLPMPLDRPHTLVTGVADAARHGEATDWRVPAWALDHWQHRLDQLRHRTAPDPAHADQPALFDLGAHP